MRAYKHTKRMKRTKRKNRTRRTRRSQRGGNPPEAVPELDRIVPSQLDVKFGVRQANGTQFLQAAVQDAPTVRWAIPPVNEYRTLLCFDPDAPAKSWLHWLVVNATGPDPASGRTYMEWTPPAPPEGAHRYYFVLSRHAYPIPEDAVPDQRGYFNVAEFVKRYALEPIAASFLRVAAKVSSDVEEPK